MLLQLYNKETGEPTVSILLTEEGERAYKAGEPIDFYKGHWSAMLNTRRILLAEF